VLFRSEQCGRNRLPTLGAPLRFDHWVAQHSMHRRILLSPLANESLHAWARHQPAQAITLMIGPEGGWSEEEERLAILLSGPVSPTSWHAREPQAADIHELVGQIQNLTRTPLEVRPAKENAANFLLTSELRAGNRVIGWIAQLHPSRARDIDARHPVYVAELLLSALRQGSTGPTKFEELPRFPGMTRDVAMEVPADLPHAKVAAFFAAQKHPLFIGAEVFDIFTDPSGQKIASDRKSIAWTLTYRASDKTLATAEVDAAHTAILTALEKTLPAKVRG
jgi:phenylalanyl-tRNA synthetase beta chain